MQTNSRKLTVAWPLGVFLLLPALTHAETAVQAWVQRYNGPGNGIDQAVALAVDSSNNVIVTGYSWGNGSQYDYATIKHSSAGVPLWTNRYNGSANGQDYAYALAVDGSDNVIVTGSSYGGSTSDDYVTIKYSSAGLPLWTNRYNGTGNGIDQASAVAVDGSNNVIVMGHSTGSGSSYDYVTVKYSSAGLPLWTNRYNGTGNGQDYPYAVAVDGNDNVIVTGYSARGSFATDYATIKYSSGGIPLWTNRYNGGGPGSDYDMATAVAVGGDDNVVVTGISWGSEGSWDYATIRYSGAGEPLWTNLYNGPGNVNDYANAVAVDRNNDVIVTGYSASAADFPFNYDYATIKYSSQGVPLWCGRYNGPGNGDDQAAALALDGDDNVIVTGYSTGGLGSDYATLKYSSEGEPLWTNRYSGGSASALAVDNSGNVIVTGESTGSGSGFDFATIKYIYVPSPVVTGIQLTNGTFQMRVDGVLQPGTLVIEASTDLAGWSPVVTNTTPTNVLFYTDPDASNSPARFYRAFQFP